MYCKKCGQQLREGAAFCGNCGTPTGIQNQNTAAGMSPNPGASMNNVVSKAEPKAEQKGKKKGGKKVLGILLLCLLLILAAGAGGWFFMFKLNEDRLEAAAEEEETEREQRETKEESEEEESEEEREMEEAQTAGEADPAAEEAAADIPAAEEVPFYHDEDESGVHTYELIVDDVTWTEAYQACLARGGHLVRINSEEEYQAILQQISEEEKGKIMFWLGGARSGADEYEYRWIYGDGTYGSEILNEDASYLPYWLEGEPSFYDESISQDEMYMNMFYVSKEQRWVWNDVPDDLIAIAEFYSGTIGYICEYED